MDSKTVSSTRVRKESIVAGTVDHDGDLAGQVPAKLVGDRDLEIEATGGFGKCDVVTIERLAANRITAFDAFEFASFGACEIALWLGLLVTRYKGHMVGLAIVD